jgi:hypothetical protein
MSETLYVAARKGLIAYDLAGGAWRPRQPSFIGQPVSAVLRDKRDGALYAALNLGHFGVKLHRSEDDGATWKELAAPAFAAQPDNIEKAPSVDLIWSLAAGGADQPGCLWAGTIPGGLFLSKDRGESWSLIEPLWNVPEREKWFGGGYDKPGIHSILVDPRDSKKLTLGVSCGGVWKSDDAGASWRNVGKGLRAAFMPPDMAYDIVSQDPHLLSLCATAPDTIWCQHHNGIFVSRDGGETFSEIENVKPSVFGFAVAAHPRDPDTAWFAPAVKDETRVPVDGRFVVTRTRDGGKTFDILDAGLPAPPAYDLIYRHALAVDEGGARLAMGSTTGNLWISSDGGETWRSVSAHLPPIAAVAWS